MNNQAVFGFVLEYVTDLEAARRFYVEVLGLDRAGNGSRARSQIRRLRRKQRATFEMLKQGGG